MSILNERQREVHEHNLQFGNSIAEQFKNNQKGYLVDKGLKDLPTFKCHKEVRAIKIHRILEKQDGSALLIPDKDGFDAISVDENYMKKHEPKSGGYFVMYKGGYKSYSPAKDFEDGYILID